VSDPLAKLREECQRLLEEAASEAYPGVVLPVIKYSQPPSLEMGELSSAVCFQLARRVRQGPAEIAEKIASRVKAESSDLIESAEAVKGYINFHADAGNFSKLVLETITGNDEEYGFVKAREPERVMVEHTSANPNAPLHIGNARNSILGACLAELLKKKGHNVVVHFLVNDMGRQVAMTTYGWKLLGRPEPKGRAELWVGAIYAGVNIVNETMRLKKELRLAEERGRAAEMAELQGELEKYEVAAKELRERFEGVYRRHSGKASPRG